MVDLIQVVTGIVLALIATPLFNLAVVFQKMGLKKSPDIVFDKGIKGITLPFKEIIKNKWWVLGAILGVIGWFPYIISMAFVGFIVSEPINSIGIIIVVVAANRILKEKLRWYEFVAILLLSVSPILIAFSGISNVSIDLYQMVFPLIIFLIVSFGLTFFFVFMAIRKKGTPTEGLYIMVIGAFFLALGGVFTNILAHAMAQSNILPTFFFWVEIGFGIFWFDYPHLWVFISWWGLAICNLCSFAFYQSAFQKARVSIAFPIIDSIGLSIPILAGMFVFRNTFDNYILFFIAIFLIFIGTISLGRFQEKIRSIDKKGETEEKIENPDKS